jgi:hypothetical protein
MNLELTGTGGARPGRGFPVVQLNEPVLRLRAEIRGKRIVLSLYTVGLPTRYRSTQILRRELESFAWRKLR